MRKIGQFILKFAGILCAFLWIIFIWGVAGKKIYGIFLPTSSHASTVANTTPSTAGIVFEASVYLLISLPGFIALRREWKKISQKNEVES